MEKVREFQKNSFFWFIDSTKPLTVWITTNYGKFVKVWEDETTLHVKEQQLELGMVKNWKGVVYYYSAYLTSMQSTSWETKGWMNHKLESRLLGETTPTSDMQMISL